MSVRNGFAAGGRRVFAFVGMSAIFGISALTALQLYTHAAQSNYLVAKERTAELDEAARIGAEILKKKTLPVLDAPYAAESDESILPIENEARQRRIEMSFHDAESGLEIEANTHLCLPGVDPCVSGGRIAVSDGAEQWHIDFQLLGSARPSDFQSNVPRSRPLLSRLRKISKSSPKPTRGEYETALGAALDAPEDSPDRREKLRNVLALLLRSFFDSAEYQKMSVYAEENGLMNGAG